MREVTMYYAYDDKEFDSYRACEDYETTAYMLMRSIEKKYSFFDRKMNLIVAPFDSSKIEDWLQWLDDAYQYCTYIKRFGSLTDDEAKIIRENLGSCIYNEDFSCAEGLFKYDFNTGRWVKVDE